MQLVSRRKLSEQPVELEPHETIKTKIVKMKTMKDSLDSINDIEEGDDYSEMERIE